MHYQRWRRHGDPLYVWVRQRNTCSVEGCDLFVVARGWCSKHHTRWKRHGSPTARLRGEVIDGKRICPRCWSDVAVDDWVGSECRPCAVIRMAAWRVANPGWYVPRPKQPAVCDYCGDAFLADRRRSRYCTQACAEANRHAANWKHLNARRSRLRDAFVESFDRLEIFERDQWVCGICRLDIDRTLAWPHPMSASLDHIVPISRGGKHARANAQASHLTCNVHKGAAA